MMRCPRHLERFRGSLQGERGDQCNGILEIRPRGLTVIFSNGMGWEHVSVSRKSRMPTYEDMDQIKQEFWEADDVVMQLHVARRNHVNCHPYCLHLWRPIDAEIPLPNPITVGL